MFFKRTKMKAASLLTVGMFLFSLLATGVPAFPLLAANNEPAANGQIMTSQAGPEYMPLRPDLVEEYIKQSSTSSALSVNQKSEDISKGSVTPLIPDGSVKPDLPGANYAPALNSSGELVTPQLGVKKNLVIMVQFPNRTFSANHTANDFNDLLFGSGNSMKSYYTEQSYGNLTVQGTVLGPYTSDYPIEYYATDYNGDIDSGLTGTVPIYELAREAVVKATTANPSFPWAEYDTNFDGIIDAVTIIHAGAGQEESVSALANATIWSHQWGIAGGQSVGGGKSIYIYNMNPETGQVGVFSHEFGHVLGLPDLYDTNYQIEGAGDWDLMAGGSWNGLNEPGDCPAGLSAWSRHYLGWLNYMVPTQDTINLPIPNTKDGPFALQLWTGGQASTTHFLVENRQRVGYDLALPGEGLMVWWVNNPESRTKINAYPPTMIPLEADGNGSLWRDINDFWSNRGDAGDPFPGSTNNTAFTYTSNPDSTGVNGAYTGVSLWNIHKDASNPALYLTDLTVNNGLILEPRTTAPATLVLNGAAAQLDYVLLNNNTTVTIVVLDGSNNWVKTLVNGQTLNRGLQSVSWDGKNSTSQNVLPGTYKFKISTVVSNSTAATNAGNDYYRNITVIPATNSTDGTLTSLVSSTGSLNPAFASGTTNYTVSVANSESSITLTPTVNESHATVTVNGVVVASGTASGAISLVAGVPKAIPVVVTAQDGITTRTYTVTVTRAAAAASSDASLSGLVPGSGSLEPTFAAGTQTYTLAVVNSVSSITLTPIVNESHATVKVNGVNVISGAASGAINLDVGVAKAIPVVVTAQDGTTKRTYTVTVTRTTSRSSSDAALKGLTPSTGSLNPAFATGTQTYTLAVANSISSIRLTPTVNESQATVKVNGVSVTSGTASGAVTLLAGVPKAIPVIVTAQDGVTTRTYKVTVTRAAAASSDATLSGLVPSSGSLNPAFAAGTLSYSVSVANSVSSITLTPIVNESHATVKVNGVSVTSGTTSGAISLVAGVAKAIPVVVTAQDGITTRTYTITVTRAAGVSSSDASLQGLTPSTGSLNPAFAAGTLSYSVSAANSVSSITLTPTVNESHATVKVDGVTVTSGTASGAISLVAGVPKTISVVVTAQDGTTTRTYTITVTRAAGVSSSDATLSGLIPNSGSLEPTFAAGTQTYTIAVVNSVSSIRLTPTVNESHATVKVNGVNVTSGTASGVINLEVGVAKAIPVVVTAQDGTTKRTYTVTVTRTSGRSSIDATLIGLTPSAGSLNPTFATGTQTYSLSVANSISSIRLTPTVNESQATVKVNGVSVTSGTASGAISLVAAVPKAIPVVVTAQDGITKRTYTVTVTRAAGVNSSDASLQGLTPSTGSLNPAFAAGTLSYSVSAANSVSTITLTPTVNESHATVKVNGVSVTSGTASGAISLVAGVAKAIPVVVTAQDGITTRTYTITVTRAAGVSSSDASLQGLTPSAGSLNPAFAGGTLSYSVSVADSVSSITLTPTVNESHATVKVNGISVTSGTASGAISLVAGVAKTIPVVVTAQDGITTRTYTVTVTRAASGISTGPTLSGLTPSTGSLNPAFASRTMEYTVAVANRVSSIRLTPLISDRGATVKVNGVSVNSGTESGSISLVAGEPKVILVVVTSQNGITTYTIIVTRATLG